MNESTLKSILEELALCEWAEYADVDEQDFSVKHNYSMKRIFKLYEKNTRATISNSESKPIKLRLTRRTLLRVLVIVFLAILAGCTAAYFISQDFYGEVYKEYTRIIPVNTENCPETIEEIYSLADIPIGFEIESIDSNPFFRYTEYMNNSTNQMIVFSQYTKSGYGVHHLNTEKYELEEVELNDYKAIFMGEESEKCCYGLLIWDNGDYIFELSANLPKDKVVYLAKSAEILNF